MQEITTEGFKPPIADIPRAGLPFVLSQYREDAIEYLFAELLAGRTLTEVSREPDMPPTRMVRQWLATNMVFREQFIEVCKAALLPEVMEAIHIADQATDVAKAKLQVETRLKFGERLLPEVFGKSKPAAKKPPEVDTLTTLLEKVSQTGHDLPHVAVAEIVED